jgi:hypothetical protein
MVESRSILLLFLVQLLLGASADFGFSREGEVNGYEFLSPLPFSLSHNPETVIILRSGEKIDAFSLKNELLEVYGDISGKHQGKFVLSLDQLTLIFIPDMKFSSGEKVTLHLNEGIKTQSGRSLPH